MKSKNYIIADNTVADVIKLPYILILLTGSRIEMFYRLIQSLSG